MKRYIEILRKTVSVIVVTFLFLQFFTVSPLISEENGSDTNISENQTTETVDNNESNTNNTDPSSGDVNNENNNETGDIDPVDNTEDPNNPGNSDDVVDPNENNDPNDNNKQGDVTDNTENNEDSPGESSESNSKDSIEIEYDIFVNEIEDVIITVKAEKGIFPENSYLYVEKIEQVKEIDEAIQEVRQENKKVAVSYTYDIKIFDQNDNEVQPNEGAKVSVSFALKHVANENLETNVYHINENQPENVTADNVEPLEVTTEGEEAIVETESFSFYTVEFTYNNLQYVLAGNTSIKLSVILDTLGLTGNVETIEVSNSQLFDVQSENGDYIVTAKQAFTSQEYLKVTIDGIEYEIVVTDTTGNDNTAQAAANNIIQNGSSNINSSNSFVKDMPIQSIHIQDLSTISPELRYGNGTAAGELKIDSNGTTDGSAMSGFIREHYANSSATKYSSAGSHPVYAQQSGATNTLGTLGGGTYAVGISSGNSNPRRFVGNYYYYRYPDAAILEDGTTADVLIRFENIYNYSTGSLGGWLTWTAVKDYPALWPKTLSGTPVGIRTDVTVMVVEKGSQNPVSITNLTNPNFFYTVRGLDVYRYNGLAYDNIKMEGGGSAGSYPQTFDRSSSVAPYKFSESVQVNRSTTQGAIYTPESNQSSLFIDDNGRFVATGNPNDDASNPGPDSYGTGFATLGDPSGTSAQAWSSARDDVNELLTKDYRGIFFMTPISHEHVVSTGTNGHVELYDNGFAYPSTTSVPTSATIDEYEKNDPNLSTIENVKRYTRVFNNTTNTYDYTESNNGEFYKISDSYASTFTGDDSQLVDTNSTGNYTLLPPTLDRVSVFKTVIADDRDPSTTDDGPRTYSIPNGKTVTYKLVPDDGYSLRILRINGSNTKAVARKADGTIAESDDQIAYYTFTFAANRNTKQTLYVEWSQRNINCVDCKNELACENCHLGLNGSPIKDTDGNKYESETLGTYRTGNATSIISKMGSSDSGTHVLDNGDTFAEPLPYGNVFIDTSKLKWDSNNSDNFSIDIPDSRFKFIGTGSSKGPNYDNDPTDITDKSSYIGLYGINSDKSVSGHPFDVDLISLSDTSENGFTMVDPTIAYYGPLHSYLMYGDEEKDIADGGTLGRYPRDNTAASDEKIAGRAGEYEKSDGSIVTFNKGFTYSTSDGGSVYLEDGVNIITPENGNSYLYKVTYKNAAVLQDGSRGDLTLTVTKVELESSYTTDKSVYVGLQKDNWMTANTSYVDKSKTNTELTTAYNNGQNGKNSIKYIPGRETITISGSGNQTIRNAVGEKITFDIQVVRNDGTPVEGVITYGVKDLDIPSYESIWGRKPFDTYKDNEGSDQNIINDDTLNAWTDTHKFYEYGEGLTINSGSYSYALLPKYSHDILNNNYSPDNYKAGQLPINQVLKQNITDGLFSSKTIDEIAYAGPLQAIDYLGSYNADGVKFVTTSTMKIRDNNGLYNGNVEPTSAGLQFNTSNQIWVANRGDEETYDSGFAVLLNAAGSSLTWSASYHTNSAINTKLFESSFSQYMKLSHGTGGGIYVEDYNFLENCRKIYRENMVTMPTGSSVQTTIVPEDGYRVDKINVDDIKITFNYDENDKPTTVTFEYSDKNQRIDPSNSYQNSQGKWCNDFDISSGCLDINDVVFPNKVKTNVTASEYQNAEFSMTITYNDDGIVDVELYDRTYSGDGLATHNIHADFDTFYYFTKVWVDAASANYNDKPTSLTLTTSPYIVEHDTVDINGTVYQISNDKEIHLDLLNDNGEKVKDSNNQSIRTPVNLDGILLNITGNRQKYPTFVVDNVTYALIGDYVYKTKNSNTDIDMNTRYAVTRTEIGYEVRLPDPNNIYYVSSKYPGENTFLVHHINNITYTDGTISYSTTDNPDHGDVVFVTIANRPQKPYSKINLNGVVYVITGDYLHQVYQDSNGQWKEYVDPTTGQTVTYYIDHKFERYNDGIYINKKTFTIRTDADVNAKGSDKTNQKTWANAQRAYVDNSTWENDGQDLVWKIRYPAKGLDVNGDGDLDDECDWPALAIETEHTHDDLHEITDDHVERLYWFVNERLGSLTGKWALDQYDNSLSEVPGYASYRDSNGNIMYGGGDAYWYLLATEDRDEVLSELNTMANLRMALMSPISSNVIKYISYADRQNGISNYSNWGGRIVNSIHQTEMYIEKQWLGEGIKDPFKLTINRAYNYKQISHDDAITNGLKVVTLPSGSEFNEILLRLAGSDRTTAGDNNARTKISRFRNGTEPLTLNKDLAQVYDGDLSKVDSTRLYKIENNQYLGETKEAAVYLWYDGDDTNGTIYIWTDADQVYLPDDASYMFYNLPQLEQISGVHNFNTSGTTDMSYMFAVPNGISGKIANLYNLRDWDVSNVTTLESFLENQDNLVHIHGIVDWNISSCDNFISFIGVPSIESNTDWRRYNGSNEKTHPFVWYPNVYIDNNGNVVDPYGAALTTAHSKTSDGTARDLIWDSTRIGTSDDNPTWWNNGSSNPTNYNPSSERPAYTTWAWDIYNPDLSYSDADKWTYRVYEDQIDGYQSVENATNIGGAIELFYNPLTGKLEAFLSNVRSTDVYVKKETDTEDDGQEFKFRIRFDSLYNPEASIPVPTNSSIVIHKYFKDVDGNYLNLSEISDDYVYQNGSEFKLTLTINNTDNTQQVLESDKFPSNWIKNSNGSWSYVFEDIDDTNIESITVNEPSESQFRYQGDTEIAKFTSANNSANVSIDLNSTNYHTATFVNTSTVGTLAAIRKANDDSLNEKTNVTYERIDGKLRERYISFDGEQYDIYDVLIAVDKDDNAIYNPDGSLKSFEVYYGGIENGSLISLNHPYEIYTSDINGSTDEPSIKRYPTFTHTQITYEYASRNDNDINPYRYTFTDASSTDDNVITYVHNGSHWDKYINGELDSERVSVPNDATADRRIISYVDSYGLHIITPCKHTLQRSEVVSEVTYQNIQDDPNQDVTSYSYIDSANCTYTYDKANSKWVKYNADGSEDTSFTGTPSTNTVAAKAMSFKDARDYVLVNENSYTFKDTNNNTYRYQGGKWHKYASDSTEDTTFVGNPPDDSKANVKVTRNRTITIWDRNVTNEIYEPEYQTTGRYKVTDPKTGLSEEYYIVEHEGGIVDASKTEVDDNGNTIDIPLDVATSIMFNAKDGSADFITTDGKEYIFRNTEIITIPNIWEFTLKKDEEFIVPNIPLGTTYEVWEYGLDGNWTLIKRDSKHLDGSDPDSETASQFYDYDNDDIKKYSLVFEEDNSGTYYKYASGSLAGYTTSAPNDNNKVQYDYYDNNISIIKRFRRENNSYIEDNSSNGNYYRLIYTTTAPNNTNANDYEGYDGENLNSIKQYQLKYIEDINGIYYSKKNNGNYEYTTDLPVYDTHNTTTGDGGLERTVGTSQILRHTFTNEKQSFSLTVDKTVKGMQGSRDQYFKFDIVLNNLKPYQVLTLNTSDLTTKFTPKDNGEWYRLIDGRYTKEEPSAETANSYVGCVVNGLSVSCTTYKEEKPNLATNFINFIMSNANNIDSDIANGRADENGDYMTYKEAKAAKDITETNYVFVDANNDTIKYIYDSTNKIWRKYIIDYIEDETGSYYFDKSQGDNGNYVQTPPTEATVINYNDYSLSNVTAYLTKYSYNSATNMYSEDSNGDYYYNFVDENYVPVNDSTYGPNDNNVMNFVGYDFNNALINVKRYKKGYKVDESFINGIVPDDAIYTGVAGQQVVANGDGEVTITVYMKHGEAVTIDGLLKNSEYTIIETIDGLKDYKTTITDGNGKNEVVSRITTGIIGATATEDPDGDYYKVNETFWKFVKEQILNNIEEIKQQKYSQKYYLNPNGTWYKLNGQFTYVAPNTSNIFDYDECTDELVASTFKKYSLSYIEDTNGTYYKLNDKTYTDVAPTNETCTNYADYTEGMNLEDIVKYSIQYNEDNEGTYYLTKQGEYVETTPTKQTCNDYEGYDVNKVINALNKYTYGFIKDNNGEYYKLSNPDYLVDKIAVIDDRSSVITYLYSNNIWMKFIDKIQDDSFTGAKTDIPSGLTFYTNVEPTIETVSNYEGFNSINVNDSDFVLVDNQDDSVTYKYIDGSWKKYKNNVEESTLTINDIPEFSKYTGADSNNLSNTYERISDYYLDYLESGNINKIKKYKMVYTERPNGIYYLKDYVYTTEAPKISFVTYYKGDDTYYETSNYIIYYRLVSDDSYTTDGSRQTREYYSIDGVPNRYIKVDNDYIRIENETYYKKTDGSYTTKEPRENDLWHYEAYDGSAAKYYVGYTDDQHLGTIKKYEDGFIPDDSGSYIKQNYTWDTPTSDYDKYVGYDGSDPNSITKYSPSYIEAANGDFIKYKNGDYISVLNINISPSNYEGYDEGSIKRYNFVGYIEDSNGQAYKFVKPQYISGSYSFSDVELTGFDLRSPIDGDISIMNTTVKYKIADDPTKVYYQLITGDYTTTPPSIDGSDLNSIKRYKVDFVEDPNGTFYRVKTNNSAIEQGYTEISPQERYYDFTTYSLNVTAKYTNTKDGIVPTKAFIGYFMPVIIMNFIALCYVLYDRRKKRLDILDE